MPDEAPAPTGSVTTIMMDTVDLDAACAFWTRLLGLEVVHRDQTYAYLAPIASQGPHLGFQLVPEEKVNKNRLHLDISVPDREHFVELVIEMGGSFIAERQEGDYPVWSVMADPLGNEFCIYTPKARQA